MRILTRYILGEVVSHALIGVAVLTFVLFTRDLGRLLELVVRNSAPLPSVAEIFFFTVPVALTYTVPMSVLIGILIGLSRLAADSEITAMRASGIGIWTFLKVVSIFVVFAWALALFNSVYLAPRSLAALGRLEDRLKTSQASFEVQPRVFYEGFPKLVLYVQDVKGASGAALWKGVFIADVSVASSPRITLAEQGLLLSEGPDILHLRLKKGSTHEVDPKNPGQYQISTFDSTEIPIQIPAPAKQERERAALGERTTTMLLEQSRRAEPILKRWELIEFHRRFALPTACLVLAMVGIPLGLSSKKGGKSTGFVLAMILVFSYYSVSLIGVSLARQNRVSPALGVWLADGVFFVVGMVLLWRAERRPINLHWLRVLSAPFKGAGAKGEPIFGAAVRQGAYERASRRFRLLSARFPMILDDYVLRDFGIYLSLIVSTFLMLLLVFTLFELLGDILRNQISPLVVASYLLNVTPYFLYNTLPLSMLLTVLVTFGMMERSNEITAIKATGISIYRLIVPVLLASAMAAGALFFSDQFYLPYANKRQDALRNQIKGKPAQTYLRPDRKWIFGQHSDIYYYQVFDPELNTFGNISVFEFEPKTFAIKKRVYAETARWSDGIQGWVFEKGWERDLNQSAIAQYKEFDVATFAEVAEPPAYFKKEIKQYWEMNFEELRRYIQDLQQSGFDVVRLRVQLQKKLAYPVITLVMAILAIPFALSAGKKGAVTGVAIAVGIAVVYLSVSGLFEAMGNLSWLPPAMAAWSPDVFFGLIGGYLILKVPT